MISFPCTFCQAPLKAEPKGSGQKVKCPRCGKGVAVPQPAFRQAPVTNAPGVLAPTAHEEQRGDSSEPSIEETVAGAMPDDVVEITSILSPPRGTGELGWLGPYRVLRVLGHGGMGVVFHAEDPQLGRPVAIKAILPRYARAPQARERFLREARAAGAIKHDNIVSIYQVGEDRGTPFLAMEFLEGQSLDQYVKKRKTIPVNEALRIGRDIANGLAEAHARGLIHRDIKPGNIWLEKKKDTAAGTSVVRVKILDFGLARGGKEDTAITHSGAIVGSPAYMAPEQAKGTAVDHRSDLFSLGCVLYRLTVGRTPFPGETTMAILASLASEKPKPPQSLNPDVPRPVSDFILKLLEKDPARRPANAKSVIETLTRLMRDLKQAPSRRKLSLGRWYYWAGAAAVVVVVLAILSAINRVRQEPVKTEPVVVKKDDPPPDDPSLNPFFVKMRRETIPPEDLAWAYGPAAQKAPRELVGIFRNHSVITASDVRLGGFCLSTDSRWLALGGPGFQVDVHDLATGKDQLGAKSSHSIGYFYQLMNGKPMLVTGSTSGTLTSRNLLTGEENVIFNAPTGVSASAYAMGPEGSYYLLGATDGRLFGINLNANTFLSKRIDLPNIPPNHSSAIVGIAVRPEGGRTISADADGALTIWTPPLGKINPKFIPRLPERLPPGTFPRDVGKIRQIAFSPDTLSLYVAFSQSQQLHILNVDRKTTSTMPIGVDVAAFAFSDDGKYLAAVSPRGSVRLFNVADEKRVAEVVLPPLSSDYGPVQIAGDNHHVLVGHPHGGVLVVRMSF